MKKFLSILLAVLMVLSNVSYAIPNAIGAMDSAAEMAVEAEPVAGDEAAANLSASAIEVHPQYGDVMWQLHFNNMTTGWKVAGQNNYSSGNPFYYGDDIKNDGVTIDTTHGNVDGGFSLGIGMTDGTVKAADDSNDGKYFSGTMGTTAMSPDTLFRLAMTNGTNKVHLTKQGVYTVSIDARIPETATIGSNANNMIRVCSGDGKYKDYNFNGVTSAWVNDGEWHTYAASFSIPDDRSDFCDVYVYAHALKNGTGTLDVDNLTIYYKPTKVNVDIYHGNKIVATKNSISTSGILVSKLISDVNIGEDYFVIGVEYNGKTYDTSDTLVFASDAEIKLVVAETAKSHNDHYGKTIYQLHFDEVTTDMEDGRQESGWHDADAVDTFGAYKGVIGTNFIIWTHSGTQKLIKDEGGNGYLHFDGNIAGEMLQMRENGSFRMTPGKVYTFTFDVRTNFAGTGKIHNYKVNSDGNECDKCESVMYHADNEWRTYTLTYVPDSNDKNPDFSIYGDKSIYGASFDIDNVSVYEKDATATIKVKKDGEIIGTYHDVSTIGYAADEILNHLNAYFNSHDATRVAYLEYGDAKYTFGDTIVVAGDCTLELVIEDNPDYDANLGTMLYQLNFNKVTNGTSVDDGWQEAASWGVHKDHTVEFDGRMWLNSSSSRTMVKKDGNGFLRFNLPFGGSTGEVFNFFPKTANITLKKGYQYTFSFDARASTTASFTASDKTEHNYMYLAKNQHAIGATTTAVHVPNDNTWHTYSFSYTPEEDLEWGKENGEDNGDYVFFFQKDWLSVESGTFDIDNITIYEKPFTPKILIYDTDEKTLLLSRTLHPDEAHTVDSLVSDIEIGSAYKVKHLKRMDDGTIYSPGNVIPINSSADIKVILVVEHDSKIYDDIHGFKIVDIDFDRPEYDNDKLQAHQSVAEEDILDTSVVQNLLWLESNQNGQDIEIKDDGDGERYLEIKKDGDNAFILRTAYHGDYKRLAKDGALTFTFDMRIASDAVLNTKHDRVSAILPNGTNNPPLKVIQDQVEFLHDGQWHTYTFAIDSDNPDPKYPDYGVGGFEVYTRAAVVDVKNIRVYHKAAEGKVTFTTEGGRIYTYTDEGKLNDVYDNNKMELADGNEYLPKNKFDIPNVVTYMPTTGFTLNDIIPLVAYDRTNYKLVGVMKKTDAFDANAVIYDETDIIHTGKDTTFSLIFKEINLDWGYVFASSTFDTLKEDKNFGDYADIFDTFGGAIYTTRFNNHKDATLQLNTYHATERSWENVKDTNGVNNGRILIMPRMGSEAYNDATYNAVSIFSVYSDIVSNNDEKYWDPLAVSLDGTNTTAYGYYTIQFSYKYEGSVSTSGHNMVRFWDEEQQHYVDRPFNLEAKSDFTTVTFHVDSKDFINPNADPADPARGYSLAGFEFYQNIASENAKLYIDDVRLTFRPYGVNVTVLDGKEVVQKETVTCSTGGVTVSDILDKLTMTPSDPFTKFVGVEFEGKQYGLNAEINFAMPVTLLTVTEKYTPDTTGTEIVSSSMKFIEGSQYKIGSYYDLAASCEGSTLSSTVFHDNKIFAFSTTKNGETTTPKYDETEKALKVISKISFYTLNGGNIIGMLSSDSDEQIVFEWEAKYTGAIMSHSTTSPNSFIVTGLEKLESTTLEDGYTRSKYVCDSKNFSGFSVGATVGDTLYIRSIKIYRREAPPKTTTVNFKCIYNDNIYVDEYAAGVNAAIAQYTFDGKEQTPANLVNNIGLATDKWEITKLIFAGKTYAKDSTEIITFAETDSAQTVYVVVAPKVKLSSVEGLLEIDGKPVDGSKPLVVEKNTLLKASSNDGSSAYYYIDNRLGNCVHLSGFDNMLHTSNEKSIRTPNTDTNNTIGFRFIGLIDAKVKSTASLSHAHSDLDPKIDARVDEYGLIFATVKDAETDPALTFDCTRKIASGTAYSVSKGIDKVFDSEDDENNKISALLYNVPAKNYRTPIESRMYVKITINHEQFIVYGDSTTFSAFEVATALNELPENEISREHKELAENIIASAPPVE